MRRWWRFQQSPLCAGCGVHPGRAGSAWTVTALHDSISPYLALNGGCLATCGNRVWRVAEESDSLSPSCLHGRGKRTGGYGSFLLAVYAPDDEELQTISKIGTGFSEEQLVQLSEQLKALVIPAPKPYYRRALPCFQQGGSSVLTCAAILWLSA